MVISLFIHQIFKNIYHITLKVRFDENHTLIWLVEVNFAILWSVPSRFTPFTSRTDVSDVTTIMIIIAFNYHLDYLLHHLFTADNKYLLTKKELFTEIKPSL